jgi:cell fate regulator YaaT (PSP1 superfamily)
MARVMAVSFERYGRLHYLDPGGSDYRVGDHVLVPTESGAEVAECVWAPEWVDDDAGFTGLPVCAGRAEEAHLQRDAENRRKRAQAKLVAKKLIRGHDLPMKVVGVDVIDSGDYDQLTVLYFTAPHRVDFRLLVGDLARALRSRIDLRQVGSRDGARLTGGLGSCGRDLCCATFLKDFEPVSLRMAKAQDLPPNPLKISGACGRLMCCLKYEHPLYAEFAREAPPVGSAVTTEDGDGVVVGHSVPADSVLVRMKDSGQVSSCSRAGVCGSRQVFATRTSELDAEVPADETPAATGSKPRARRRRRALPPD